MRDWQARSGMLRNADNGAGGSGGTPGAQGDSANAGDDGAQNAPTFETWYAGLDAATKALIDGNTAGLKTALSSERTQRQELARQIADAQKGAGKDTDLAKQLAAVQNTLALTERRANFNEEAMRPDVGCVNVKVAWALAQAEDLFDRQGRPDWNALKAAAPELFRRAGAGSADGGAGNNQTPKVGMNEMIRRAAGRG